MGCRSRSRSTSTRWTSPSSAFEYDRVSGPIAFHADQLRRPRLLAGLYRRDRRAWADHQWRPDDRQHGNPPGHDEAGLLNAIVKVPGDLNPNATLFFGAHCPQASFLASACPSNTVVGLATAASPLLSTPLVGNVALVDGGTFPNLGLDLKGQLHLLLQGATNASSAGNTVTFNGLPDIPISRFQLTFTNPPGLLGTARDICTPPAPVFHADFTGYNGASTSVDSPATVDGCGAGNTGGKCKKHKAKKKHKHRAAESKKHKKKSSCKKKKHKKKHHK